MTFFKKRFFFVTNIMVLISLMFMGFQNKPNLQEDSSDFLQKILDESSIAYLGDSTKCFYVSKTLKIHSNQSIIGNGVKIIQTSSAMPILDCANLKNIKIKGLFLKGKGDDYSPTSTSKAVGIYCYGVQNISIEGCRFESFSYSPVSGLREVRKMIFKNNICIGTGLNNSNFYQKDHTGITVGGNNIVISNNSICKSSQGIIVAEDSDGVMINDNKIFDIPLEHGIYVDTSCKNINLNHNSILNVNGSGIKVQNREIKDSKCYNITITNNDISQTLIGDGILVNNSEGSSLFADKVVIGNNRVKDIGQHGINVRITKNALISKNTIENVKHTGIYLKNNDRLIVDKNKVLNTQECGLFDEGGGKNTLISRNKFVKNGLSSNDKNGLSSSLFIAKANQMRINNNEIIGNPVTTQYNLYLVQEDKSSIIMEDNDFKGARDLGVRISKNNNNFKSFKRNKIQGKIAKMDN